MWKRPSYYCFCHIFLNMFHDPGGECARVDMFVLHGIYLLINAPMLLTVENIIIIIINFHRVFDVWMLCSMIISMMAHHLVCSWNTHKPAYTYNTEHSVWLFDRFGYNGSFCSWYACRSLVFFSFCSFFMCIQSLMVFFSSYSLLCRYRVHISCFIRWMKTDVSLFCCCYHFFLHQCFLSILFVRPMFANIVFSSFFPISFELLIFDIILYFVTKYDIGCALNCDAMSNINVQKIERLFEPRAYFVAFCCLSNDAFFHIVLFSFQFLFTLVPTSMISICHNDWSWHYLYYSKKNIDIANLYEFWNAVDSNRQFLKKNEYVFLFRQKNDVYFSIHLLEFDASRFIGPIL